MLRLKEIFQSIDGEVSPFHQGKITTFIRVSGCSLSCFWCDSIKSQKIGSSDRVLSTEKLIKQFYKTHIKKLGSEKITITGGEPLLQEEGVSLLTHLALNDGLKVTIETNGSIIPKKEFIFANPKEYFNEYSFGYIVDYKLPSSGMEKKMNLEWVNIFGENDIWKFVIGDYKDYKRARQILKEYGGKVLCKIAFQPVFGVIDPKLLLNWMLRDKLYQPILSVQIHKIYRIK